MKCRDDVFVAGRDNENGMQIYQNSTDEIGFHVQYLSKILQGKWLEEEYDDTNNGTTACYQFSVRKP